MNQAHTKPRGGAFLLAETTSPIFTPEDFTSEHKMILQLARDFIEKEVLPKNEQLEKPDYDAVTLLLKKAGELGLLAHSVPEAYEGLGLDKMTKVIVSEEVGKAGGYGVAHSNHTCIATLPITYFGSHEQKQKYLPKLASGEYLGAYCLTEPSSGSDALSAKTTAKLNEAGTHYILNGTKQFITNASFSDTFIVYAKVDGVHFTAFIVEKGFRGLSLGPEEKKMGIKSSSTRQVILEDCLVPIQNVLGEVGRGHVIAFNVLNLGRFNLGSATMGGAKAALAETLQYTSSRNQFKKSIASFPATQEKLATIASRIYASESLQYRTAELLESVLHDAYEELPNALIGQKLMEYAIECSICKVFGSETLDLAVDEGVQLHGGYGFIQEYRIEQMYRDSRINRIYEGTNEVNRLLIPNQLLRKASSGEFSLLVSIEAAKSQFQNQPQEGDSQAMLLQTVRNAFLVLLSILQEKYQEQLDAEQEAVMKLSEIAIYLYSMESAWCRTAQAVAKNGEGREEAKRDLTLAYLYDSIIHVEALTRNILFNVMPFEEASTYWHSMSVHFSCFQPTGQRDRKRRIALRLLESKNYTC